MSEEEAPRFYTSRQAWPTYVRQYAYLKCWERQQEAQGGMGGPGEPWKAGGDDDVLCWIERGRNGNRPMATAAEIWPSFVERARLWAEQKAREKNG